MFIHFGQMSKFTQNNTTLHKQHIHNIFIAPNLTICSYKNFYLNQITHVRFLFQLPSYHMTFCDLPLSHNTEKSNKKGDDMYIVFILLCITGKPKLINELILSYTEVFTFCVLLKQTIIS